MSQRREVEARIALYEDLTGILGAMRSFALAELRKVSQREAAQQQVVQSLAVALDDLTDSLPESIYSESGTPGNDTWLLFGSVRGFCSSFNEDVIRLWQSESKPQGQLILIGERLHTTIGNDNDAAYRLRGADGSLDAAGVIDRILEALQSLETQAESGLIAVIRDEHGARYQRLWPLPTTTSSKKLNSPFTYMPATAVATGVAEQYLFHSLLALLLRSIRIENHMRLIQMETALRHLEHGGEELLRQRNRLRQEEIVEEIELMAGRR